MASAHVGNRVAGRDPCSGPDWAVSFGCSSFTEGPVASGCSSGTWWQESSGQSRPSATLSWQATPLGLLAPTNPLPRELLNLRSCSVS